MWITRKKLGDIRQKLNTRFHEDKVDMTQEVSLLLDIIDKIRNELRQSEDGNGTSMFLLNNLDITWGKDD